MTTPNTAALRRRLQRRMTSAVQIGTLQLVEDPVTHILEEQFVAKWSGQALVRPTGRESTWFTPPTGNEVIAWLDVFLPIDAEVSLTDKVKVTASDDPDLVDRTLNITTLYRDEWQISRRLVCTVSG